MYILERPKDRKVFFTFLLSTFLKMTTNLSLFDKAITVSRFVYSISPDWSISICIIYVTTIWRFRENEWGFGRSRPNQIYQSTLWPSFAYSLSLRSKIP